MPITIVVGTQWGDEGKGKVTDILAARADAVVRCQGGNNAGHTVVAANHTLKLRLIPSGILSTRSICVMGNGIVFDPSVLVAELDGLTAASIETGHLRLSQDAHVITPWHRALDTAREERAGSAIGTTRQGIGPAYADKAARVGIRAGELLNQPLLRERLEEMGDLHNQQLTTYYNSPPLAVGEVFEELCSYAEQLGPLICDTTTLLHDYLEADRQLLLEGAQGTLLDIDHGSYPFVTSSSTVAGGLLAGAGLGPMSVTRVIGVTKAYVTRVGGGPLPTEQDGEIGRHLSERGHEFGTVTGRARRCGWLDIPLLKRAIKLSGVSELVVTKLDVLSGLPELMLCTGYKVDGNVTLTANPESSQLANATPQYETLPGWEGGIEKARGKHDLPMAANAYLEWIEALVGLPISLVSVGPDRESTFEFHQ